MPEKILVIWFPFLTNSNVTRNHSSKLHLYFYVKLSFVWILASFFYLWSCCFWMADMMTPVSLSKKHVQWFPFNLALASVWPINLLKQYINERVRRTFCMPFLSQSSKCLLRGLISTYIKNKTKSCYSQDGRLDNETDLTSILLKSS